VIKSFSHEVYLSYCKQNKLVPKGLKVKPITNDFQVRRGLLNSIDLECATKRRDALLRDILQKRNSLLREREALWSPMLETHPQLLEMYKNFTDATLRRELHNKTSKAKRDSGEARVLDAFQDYWKGFEKTFVTNLPESFTSRNSHVLDNHDTELLVINTCERRQLTKAETSVLQKGLNFCPRQSKVDYLQLRTDLQTMERNLRLRAHFDTSLSATDSMLESIPGCSNYMPPKLKEIDDYVSAVTNDIDEALEAACNRKPDNLSREERDALNGLRNDSDIVIKSADKGGAIVVMDKKFYVEACSNLLGDSKFYKQITQQEASGLDKSVAQFLDSLKRKVNDKILKRLRQLSSVPGRFYALPKVHKPGMPFRPIVSGNGTITEPLSALADHLLAEIPPTFPTYIKDTTDFLKKLSDVKNDLKNAILVTADITALYNNIPIKDGIKACMEKYAEQNYKPISSPHLQGLLEKILTCNYFEFGDQLYLQTFGVAMGTKMAPNFANVYVGIFENEFLASQPHKPCFIVRFIDDYFLIWTDGEEALRQFLDSLQKANPNLKFTFSCSRTEVNFLDVTVTLTNGKLATKIYKKPTDSPQYLHFGSEHPHATKTSIPYSQALRYRRVCSNTEDAETSLNGMKTRFRGRGYPMEVVHNAIQTSRTPLERQPRQRKQASHVKLVTTYNSNAPCLKQILSRNLPILQQNPDLKKIFTEAPSVVFRRPQNLRDLLISSRLERKRTFTGSGPCHKGYTRENSAATRKVTKHCGICRFMSPTVQTCSSKNGEFNFEIRGDFCCDTPNVVYCFECNICKVQYIGETSTAFRYRFNNHVKDYKCSVEILARQQPARGGNIHPVAKHFHETNHSLEDFRVYILKSGFRSITERKSFESFLIHRLDTLQNGLNGDSGCFIAYVPPRNTK
jgi:hypothetical protein